MIVLSPQSSQSVAKSQKLFKEPGPPSSQLLSFAKMQVFSQNISSVVTSGFSSTGSSFLSLQAATKARSINATK